MRTPGWFVIRFAIAVTGGAMLGGCASRIGSDRSHVAGAYYDGQIAGCGIVRVGADEYGATGEPPAEFLYRWSAPGTRNESATVLKRLAVVVEWRALRRSLDDSGARANEWTLAEFPEFHDGSTFHRRVAERLSKEARQFVAENSEEATWRDAFGTFRPRDFDHYETLSTDLRCAEHDVVSVELVEGCFPTRGGAYDISTYNFVNDYGMARPFDLADLFVPGSGWEQALSQICLAEFRRGNSDNASLVADGTIDRFAPEALARFTVSNAGLQIHFGCFEVTRNGGGEREIEIPWPQLREFLRRDGPARFLAPARTNSTTRIAD